MGWTLDIRGLGLAVDDPAGERRRLERLREVGDLEIGAGFGATRTREFARLTEHQPGQITTAARDGHGLVARHRALIVDARPKVTLIGAADCRYLQVDGANVRAATKAHPE